MNSENIKKVTNEAIEQLITALNGGRSEMLTQYLAAIGRFHCYSLRNVMLIASQKPTATHVAGFHAWHKLGRFVKKGEKGILILAPVVRRKNESEQQSEMDESSTAVGFRAAHVFDISQTDGQELPEIGRVNGDPRECRERLGKFITELGIALEYSQDIAPALAASGRGAQPRRAPGAAVPPDQPVPAADRHRAVGVGEHRQHAHPQHLRQTRRRGSLRGGPPRPRAAPPLCRPVIVDG